jgi:hypothetical protein
MISYLLLCRALNLQPPRTADLLASKSRNSFARRSPLSGQEFEPGWSVDIKMRTNGASAGTCDVYYFNGEGKRYRSRAEVRVSVVGG